jgi:dolichyl-phosphate beta-glucosyltransferase
MLVQLSVVIPAYNEAARLPPYLTAVRHYLKRVFGPGHEVFVVDDGSTDGLEQSLRSLASGWPQFTLLRHKQNQGKGAAIQTGVQAARGRYILFTDADGAAPIEEEGKLRQALARGAELAIGSRYRPSSTVARTRAWHRSCAGRLFALCARLLLRLPIDDTQCGFKMLPHDLGKRLCSHCEESGYLLDLELIARAVRAGCRVAEVPICWREVSGSKLSLARDGWKMLRGLWRMRRRLSGRQGVSAACPPPHHRPRRSLPVPTLPEKG